MAARPTSNWIQFHGETGGYKVKMERDDRSPSHPRGKAVTRRHYRYQIQGPNAWKILEKLNGGPIAGREVLHHGHHQYCRAQGAVRCATAWPARRDSKIWGPYDQGDEIREAILEAGKEFGMVPVGSRAYASNTLSPAGFHRRCLRSIPARR